MRGQGEDNNTRPPIGHTVFPTWKLSKSRHKSFAKLFSKRQRDVASKRSPMRGRCRAKRDG